MIVTAVVVTAGLGYLLMPEPVDVEIVLPSVGAMAVITTEEGETRSKERYVVAAPVAGRLMRLSMREGDWVHEGEVVAELAPLPLTAQEREEAEARVAAARAAYREAQERVRHAAEDHAQAQRELQRVERLVRERFLSPQAGEQAANATTTAGNDLAAARARASTTLQEVRVAEAGLLAIKEHKRGRWPVVPVHAPFAGAVLSIPERSERVVAAGEPLLTIGNPHDLEIVVELLSTEAVKVRPQMPVRLEGWGGEQVVQGEVRLVEPHAFTKVSALGIEEKRTRVIIDVIDPPSGLGDGFRVIASVVLWQTDHARKLPASSLFRCGNDQWCVFRLEGGRVRRTEVGISHRNSDEVELLSSLADSVQVVRYPQSSLRDGQRVKVRAGT
ncbi:efflux RND transporter periplasmic adaptor subunit [Cupriavidus sp. YR651]|uniref:efflux RND transporter periplasmic adaptor subunit n=1 Tax=Cupriavidus sp. YR651 TaxID=1855315 RepID=UPI0015A3B209|nr:HlyD family efflux transporter periplasmic adaptor subunit [Cupriavidus sp. YR651]